MNLREEMTAIYTEAGILTPAVVVDAARPDDHPLHSRFEWEDAVAGEAYRQQQAHELIRSVRVVHTRADLPELSVRAFHSVRTDDGFAYKPVDEIIADPLTLQMLLGDMRREWVQLRTRYEQFEEFRALIMGDLKATG